MHIGNMIRKLLLFWQKPRSKPVERSTAGDNPSFIRLIQLMRTDAKMRDMICKIISLDEFNRCSLINTILHQMSLTSAPKEYRETLELLKDTAVCKKILEIIAEGDTNAS